MIVEEYPAPNFAQLPLIEKQTKPEDACRSEAKDIPLTPRQHFFVSFWFNMVHQPSRDSHRVRAMNPRNVLRELQTFIGEVDVLRGEFGADGRRMGDACLTVYRDDEVVKATAYLSAEQYDCALRAHMGGRRVQIRCVLKREPRLSVLDGIVSFGLLDAVSFSE
jgi:hypothetical protein